MSTHSAASCRALSWACCSLSFRSSLVVCQPDSQLIAYCLKVLTHELCDIAYALEGLQGACHTDSSGNSVAITLHIVVVADIHPPLRLMRRHNHLVTSGTQVGLVGRASSLDINRKLKQFLPLVDGQRHAPLGKQSTVAVAIRSRGSGLSGIMGIPNLFTDVNKHLDIV